MVDQPLPPRSTYIDVHPSEIKPTQDKIFEEGTLDSLSVETRRRFIQRIADLEQMLERSRKPIPAIIFCPYCLEKHIDKKEWATRIPHRTHLCDACNREFRSANVPTVGVEELPEESTGG